MKSRKALYTRQIATSSEGDIALAPPVVTPAGGLGADRSRRHGLGHDDRFGCACEIFMDCRNGLRSVADRRRDPLDRACAHVADRKDAAAAGFERQAGVANLLARKDEAPRIE